MKKFREPINGFTHLFGAVVSLMGMILMIGKTIIEKGNNLSVSAVIIFGLSLVFLYTASSVYHLVNSTDKVIRFLRKLDHSMIFVLIAGTYTPLCLIALDGTWRWCLFSLIWGIALLGVLFKMFWFNAPRWISTATYIFMGWLVVIAFAPLSKSISIAGFVWMALGGIFYTIGGVMYALKLPNISVKFGFHELFHCFILLGSLSHFILVFNYVI
ncbi:PAQR family membrane homeostasis protein TrhA [Inconstantimicrobium mannanitabidum]|uniref:Hemolysin III n=1 Tax=Inconstantimicrobium mannanitabidum TaxID=1604901 RepID=A0ACB5RE25_9CLOT|nr:hemolysin III family protein [Clostridium sp. TW13]GKX67009.1 hemolysin III [Clostridium sp. TW13]